MYILDFFSFFFNVYQLGFTSGSSDSKESSSNVGDLGWIPGLGRFPGEGNGNPLQYSCLENSMDRGAWRSTVHGGPKELDMTERLTHQFSNLGTQMYPNFGLCGRRRGWDVSREQHQNMYIIYGETDHQPRLDARDKCSGLVHWEDPVESGRVGGGRGDRDGNTCKSMADSCQCLAKTTTIL